MGKKITRSSHSVSKSGEDDFQTQNLLKNPEEECCNYTDREIESLKSFFPESTIFKPFDQNLRSDAISKNWVCFPAFPFKIGFSYPFPALTTEFFSRTGLSFAQAMPMIWRVLYTVENLISEKDIDFGLEELAMVYHIRSHGSSRYIFKTQSGREHPILRCTQSGENWKKQFFFVKRSSIPGGNSLPFRWISKPLNFSKIFPPTERSEDKVEVFYCLQDCDRTFKPRILVASEASDIQGSGSNMSGLRRSSSRFNLDDIDKMAEIKSVKKEAASPSIVKSEPRAPVPKAAGKKRKGSEASSAAAFTDLDFSEVFEMLSQGLDRLRQCQEVLSRDNVEYRRIISDMKRIAEAKTKQFDEKMAEYELLKKKSLLAEDLHAAEIHSLLEGAKDDAAVSIYLARLKMAKEANDPTFDRSAWDVKKWRQVVTDLGGKLGDLAEDAEEAGGSGAAEDAAAKDAGKEVTLGDDGEDDKA